MYKLEFFDKYSWLIERNRRYLKSQEKNGKQNRELIMLNLYNTIVFANGQVMQWRTRDIGQNRFKVCLSVKQESFIDERWEDLAKIADDCEAEEFATICRYISEIE